MINESRAAVVMSRQPSSAVIRTHQDFQSLSALGNYFKVFENQFQKVSFYKNFQWYIGNNAFSLKDNIVGLPSLE